MGVAPGENLLALLVFRRARFRVVNQPRFGTGIRAGGLLGGIRLYSVDNVFHQQGRMAGVRRGYLFPRTRAHHGPLKPAMVSQQASKIPKEINVGKETVGGSRFALIGGPCVIEDENLALVTAGTAAEICRRLDVAFIYKSSYLKDNRSSHETYQGPGLEEGLRILRRVRDEVGVPVLSDVHTPAEVPAAAAALDCLQLPAYLSKQTQLTLALAKTGKPVNVKKGQFLKPEQISIPIRKVESVGNYNILLTERGTVFGYGDIVFDPRAIVTLKGFGYPVFFDVTHVVRLPGATSDDPRGGLRDFIFPLARAAVAAGCDGLFVEFHPDPGRALCDAASMLPLERLEELLRQCLTVFRQVREWPDL